MGSLNCCKDQTFYTQVHSDLLRLQYGEDEKIKNIIHTHPIKCSNLQVKKVLSNLTQALSISKTLYKDPFIETKPIKLMANDKQVICTFERPYMFLKDYQVGTPYDIFSQHSQPSQIEIHDQLMQYFGVFLCFLSNKPHLIKDIILTEQNTYGIYCLQAYIHGIKKYIFIDDFILCHHRKPFFTQAYQQKYIWTNLLEKAWLKINKNKNALASSNPQSLFNTFLPIPLQKIYLYKDNQQIQNKQRIIEIFKSKNISETEYILRTKENPRHLIGISGRKYLFVLASFEYNHKVLFCLRNPCKQEAFRGAHSQVSHDIQHIVEKKLQISLTNGNFILDEDQFIEQIQQVNCLHNIPSNQISSFAYPFKNKKQYFLSFQLNQSGPLSIFMMQNHQIEDNQHSPITYQILSISERKLIGGYQNREGCFGFKRINLLDHKIHHVAQGDYLFRIKVKNNKLNSEPISSIIYSYFPQAVKIVKKSQSQANEKWRQLLIQKGRKALSKTSYHAHKKRDCSHVICWFADLAFVYIKKQTKKKRKIKVQVNFSELINLQCLTHQNITANNYRVLQIQDEELIIFQKINLTRETSINNYHLQSF